MGTRHLRVDSDSAVRLPSGKGGSVVKGTARCLTCHHRDGGVCYQSVCSACGMHQPCMETHPDYWCPNYEEHPYGSYEKWLEAYPDERRDD